MNKYNCAIMFNKIELESKIVFLPMRLCIGEYNVKDDVFHDYMSNSILPNIRDCSYLGLDTAFGNVMNIPNIFQVPNVKKPLLKFVSESKNQVIVATFNMSEKKFVFKKVKLDDLREDDNLIVKYPNIEEQIERLKTEREMMDVTIDELAETFSELYTNPTTKNNVDDRPVKISELYEGIKSEVISQDKQIRKIITAVYKNLMFDGKEMKSNILIYGPTGVGKTQILRSLSKRIGVPLWIEDMTKYTESGYKGGDVEDILYNVLENANMNQSLAERSILVLDEIDKKAGSNGDNSISKSDVLKNLLSIIEGGIFPLNYRNEVIQFDTSKLTIVACGAFTDLRDRKLTKGKPIGFGKDEETPSVNEITIEDFKAYGMPLEFIGRFRTIVQMNELNKEDFIKILKTSSLSPLKKYTEELEKLGIDFEVTDKIYDRLATQALKYKTGARALNIVVDQMFEDVLYDIFDNTSNVGSLDLVDDEKQVVRLELRKREKHEKREAEDSK